MTSPIYNRSLLDCPNLLLAVLLTLCSVQLGRALEPTARQERQFNLAVALSRAFFGLAEASPTEGRAVPPVPQYAASQPDTRVASLPEPPVPQYAASQPDTRGAGLSEPPAPLPPVVRLASQHRAPFAPLSRRVNDGRTRPAAVANTSQSGEVPAHLHRHKSREPSTRMLTQRIPNGPATTAPLNEFEENNSSRASAMQRLGTAPRAQRDAALAVAVEQPGQMQQSVIQANAELPEPAPEYLFEESANQFARPKIIFRPAVPGLDYQGHRVLEPRVELLHGELASMIEPTPEMEMIPTPGVETVDGPLSGESFARDPIVDSFVPETIVPAHIAAGRPANPLNDLFGRLLGRLDIQSTGDIGIGRERVMYAPFEIDITQPFNNFRTRFDAAYDWEFPDRAAYLWAKTPGSGPANGTRPNSGERSVDYQDFRFLLEFGGGRFSAATEVPIRILDPELRENTAGLGNMNVTTKIVLVDAEKWQMTQLFRSHFNTGAVSHGLGNGHVSLEPGVLYRYKWSDVTYAHGQVKYWFPLGADPAFAGQVLGYGAGLSHLWIDTDNFAVIPTFELVAWTVLDGLQTPPGEIMQDANGNPILDQIDGLNIFNIHPGLRFVHDTGGKALFEFGISSGFSVTDGRWYKSLLRLDARWSF